MKTRRIVFFCLAGASLLGALYSGMRIFYFLFISSCALSLVLLALNLYTLLAFGYLQKLSRSQVTSGETATLHVHLSNEKPLPFSMVKVTLHTVYEGAQDGYYRLLPNQSEELELSLSCPYRGVYDVGMHQLIATDILGLFSLRMPMKRLYYYKMPRLTVYPAIVPLPLLPTGTGQMQDSKQKHSFHSQEAASWVETRAYRKGDLLNKIHWKLTARKQELLVRVSEETSYAQVLLAIDTTPHGLQGQEASAMEDLLCACAASLGAQLLAQGLPTRMAGYQQMRSTRSALSGQETAAMLAWLSELSFDSPYPFGPVVLSEMRALGRSATLYALTSQITGDLWQVLLQLAMMGLGVYVIVCLQEGHEPMDYDALRSQGVHVYAITSAMELPSHIRGAS